MTVVAKMGKNAFLFYVGKMLLLYLIKPNKKKTKQEKRNKCGKCCFYHIVWM